MLIGGCKGVREGVIIFKRCDSAQGVVKAVRKVTVVRKCYMQPSGRCERYKKGMSVDGEV